MEIIKSELLSKFENVIHGISTRGEKFKNIFQNNLSYSVGDDAELVSENRNIFYSELEIEKTKIVSIKQIHSKNVLIVEKPGEYYECDGIITNLEKLFLQISVADCVPILLYDYKLKIASAVHAGWRGTEKNIVQVAVIKMVTNYNSNPKNIIAFIGPSAGECCYEVSKEVWSKFDKNYYSSSKKETEKKYLNIKKANQFQLLDVGLLKKNIEISRYCTICNKKFHSYRRDGNKSGRMLAVIGFK